MNRYVKQLKMEKHIEGGYFSVFYRSEDKVKPQHSRYQHAEQRDAGSSIYFLLDRDDFSAWHRIKSDEIWHYYDGGSPVVIYIINDAGEIETHWLGNPALVEGAAFQVALPAGCWFAAELQDQTSFALMGCTVSPGFEDDDFELADRQKLIAQYPELTDYITRFTREVSDVKPA